MRVKKRYETIQKGFVREGNCWDNAVAESFFRTLKEELVYQQRYKTRLCSEGYEVWRKR